VGAAVITIAMIPGSHGDEIGRRVAGALGFRYIDDQIIDRAAERAGVSRRMVDAVEHSSSLVARILDALSLSTVGQLPVPPPGALGDESPAYRALIQQVIRETAAEGNVVIFAHAAGMLLAGMPGLLRVLITASAETRAARLHEAEELDAGAAARRVAHDDRERAAYFKRFYNLNQELPTHYDLIINTDALTMEQATNLVLCATAP
jgi:hypothetical protein